jgi:hypothetical protein
MRIQHHQHEDNLDLVFQNSRPSPKSGCLDFPQFLTTRLGKTCSSLLLPKSPGHEDQPYDCSDQSPPARMQGQPCPMQSSCRISGALLQDFMVFQPCWSHGRTTTRRNYTRLQRLQLLRPPETFALHSRPTLAINLMPRQARDQISLPVPEYVWSRKACSLERSLRLWAWHDTGYYVPSTSFLRARGPNNVAKRSASDHGQRLSGGEVQQCNGAPPWCSHTLEGVVSRAKRGFFLNMHARHSSVRKKASCSFHRCGSYTLCNLHARA